MRTCWKKQNTWARLVCKLSSLQVWPASRFLVGHCRPSADLLTQVPLDVCVTPWETKISFKLFAKGYLTSTRWIFSDILSQRQWQKDNANTYPQKFYSVGKFHKWCPFSQCEAQGNYVYLTPYSSLLCHKSQLHFIDKETSTEKKF